jgi:hypothetical protein
MSSTVLSLGQRSQTCQPQNECTCVTARAHLKTLFLLMNTVMVKIIFLKKKDMLSKSEI